MKIDGTKVHTSFSLSQIRVALATLAKRRANRLCLGDWQISLLLLRKLSFYFRFILENFSLQFPFVERQKFIQSKRREDWV